MLKRLQIKSVRLNLPFNNVLSYYIRQVSQNNTLHNETQLLSIRKYDIILESFFYLNKSKLTLWAPYGFYLTFNSKKSIYIDQMIYVTPLFSCWCSSRSNLLSTLESISLSVLHFVEKCMGSPAQYCNMKTFQYFHLILTYKTI